MGAVSEDVDGMGDVVGGKHACEPVGVFRRNVRVLSGMPDEEGRSRLGHHGVQGCGTTRSEEHTSELQSPC